MSVVIVKPSTVRVTSSFSESSASFILSVVGRNKIIWARALPAKDFSLFTHFWQFRKFIVGTVRANAASFQRLKRMVTWLQNHEPIGLKFVFVSFGGGQSQVRFLQSDSSGPKSGSSGDRNDSITDKDATTHTRADSTVARQETQQAPGKCSNTLSSNCSVGTGPHSNTRSTLGSLWINRPLASVPTRLTAHRTRGRVSSGFFGRFLGRLSLRGRKRSERNRVVWKTATALKNAMSEKNAATRKNVMSWRNAGASRFKVSSKYNNTSFPCARLTRRRANKL